MDTDIVVCVIRHTGGPGIDTRSIDLMIDGPKGGYFIKLRLGNRNEGFGLLEAGSTRRCGTDSPQAAGRGVATQVISQWTNLISTVGRRARTLASVSGSAAVFQSMIRIFFR